MKLSLFIGAEHRPTDSMAQRLSEHIEQVRLARQLGFDGVSIGNHLSYGSTAWFPPFETLMRLAAEADGMVLPDVDVTHVARAAAEIARGLTAGDDCALEVRGLLQHWFPVLARA